MDNPEYLSVEVDSSSKILSGRKIDGTRFENVGFETFKISIDGAIIENIQDPEVRTEIKIDHNGKILSYRDVYGVMHEKAGLQSESYIFSKKNAQEIVDALVCIGYTPNYPCDHSDESFVTIDKPRFAKINLVTETPLPTTKTDDYEGYFEYSDTNGNSFRKPIKNLNAQGRSSRLFPKKNYGFDFADDSKIKFGYWVAQDSFHLKANYIDSFRGARQMIGYNLTNQIMNTYKFEEARPWRKLISDDITIFNGLGSVSDDLNSEARGVPDGFPFKLYHNGVYVGLYTLQLKKHRDNYNMNKKKAKMIHIDGEQYNTSLFNGSNNIDWTLFEVRNPKDLKDIDGNKYDGDNPKELSDTDTLSATVKGYIKDFSDAASAITTTAEFEALLDVDYCIDYVLLMNFVMNCDVFTNNTQWCTWNGTKWFPMNYDNDQLFGLWWEGFKIRDTTGMLPSDCMLGVNYQTGTPLSLLFTLYKSRMDTRYKELVDAGIFTVKNIVNQLMDWCSIIGQENYKEDFNLWPETPSYRNGSATYPNYPTSGGFYESIIRVEKYMIERKTFMDSYFNYNHN